jgi:hypothetical protein
LGWGLIVSIDLLEDFNFGGVGEMILGFIACDFIPLSFITSNIITFDIDGEAWW